MMEKPSYELGVFPCVLTCSLCTDVSSSKELTWEPRISWTAGLAPREGACVAERRAPPLQWGFGMHPLPPASPCT